jgi:hypothetical protein
MMYVLKLAQQQNSINSSWADSHIKVEKFSNDLRTDCPHLRDATVQPQLCHVFSMQASHLDVTSDTV